MEINFEKRYVLLYTLILAMAHHIILNINSIYGGIIKSIWPVDVIVLVVALLFLSIFNRNQKQRISLGIIYKRTPFEKAFKYIKKDNRINTNCEKIQKLNNISNSDFYKIYYKPVSSCETIKSKNSEFCVVRDIVFTIFTILILMVIFTMIWPENFYKELIASILAYTVGIISCNMKAKDFVSQIVIENLNKEEKK